MVRPRGFTCALELYPHVLPPLALFCPPVIKCIHILHVSVAVTRVFGFCAHKDTNTR